MPAVAGGCDRPGRGLEDGDEPAAFGGHSGPITIRAAGCGCFLTPVHRPVRSVASAFDTPGEGSNAELQVWYRAKVRRHPPTFVPPGGSVDRSRLVVAATPHRK